jgi:CsoR family transcriptional regulator, copper-sensing transcriptional repressor
MQIGEDKARMVARLKRIEGQVAGIRRMIESETYCVDVLHQFSAVQGALAKAAQGILGAHLQTCVSQAFAGDDETDCATKVTELVELFGRYGRVLGK